MTDLLDNYMTTVEAKLKNIAADQQQVAVPLQPPPVMATPTSRGSSRNIIYLVFFVLFAVVFLFLVALLVWSLVTKKSPVMLFMASFADSDDDICSDEQW